MNVPALCHADAFGQHPDLKRRDTLVRFVFNSADKDSKDDNSKCQQKYFHIINHSD